MKVVSLFVTSHMLAALKPCQMYFHFLLSSYNTFKKFNMAICYPMHVARQTRLQSFDIRGKIRTI
jgi:hypothetical protein